MTVLDTVTVAQGREVAAQWLGELDAAMRARDGDRLADLFLPDGYWRDILALSWDLRTFAGPELIGRSLGEAAAERGPRGFHLEDNPPEVFERRRWGWTIEAFFTFETDIAHCRGHLRLLVDPGAPGRWKAWTLLTEMQDLTGFEETAGANRPAATVAHGTSPGSGSSPAVPVSDVDEPAVLVIGAGQAGLTIAARLAGLGVPALVVEREPRVGDNWRNRYQSLVLHNQVWANHLPYLPFPATWPVYISKDQLSDWLEAYASMLSLDVWTGTTVVEAGYDHSAHHWTITLQRADGEQHTIRPRHVVLASGVFGVPNRPTLPGAEDFDGVITHATEYRGEVHAEDRRVLVVGSGSSAHDVAQDLHHAGARVTMLQRSSTCVVSVEPGAARAYSIYREGGPPIEDCDLSTNAFPLPLLAELHKELTERIAEMDTDLLEGLRTAGFATDFGEDGSGFLMKYHRTGGGYYINVGCSDLIVAGEIKVKQGVEIARMRGRTVTFTDGSTLDADMVVVATGYKNMSESVRLLLGDDVAGRVGPVWGLDAEGEVRAMWKRTGQPGLWIMGGSLQQCRPYSKYLALQIKGQELGLQPPLRSEAGG